MTLLVYYLKVFANLKVVMFLNEVLWQEGEISYCCIDIDRNFFWIEYLTVLLLRLWYHHYFPNDKVYVLPLIENEIGFVD